MLAEKPIPLSQVLQALSAHLAALGAQTARLENAVSQGLTGTCGLSDDLICEMQALDRVNQGLQDLSVLSVMLAKHLGAETLSPLQVEEICTSLQLSSTKIMFSQTGTLQPQTAVPTKPSDLDLF